jgi:hypothetical protein
MKFTGRTVTLENAADVGWNQAVKQMKDNMEKYLDSSNLKG